MRTISFIHASWYAYELKINTLVFLHRFLSAHGRLSVVFLRGLFHLSKELRSLPSFVFFLLAKYLSILLLACLLLFLHLTLSLSQSALGLLSLLDIVLKNIWSFLLQFFHLLSTELCILALIIFFLLFHSLERCLRVTTFPHSLELLAWGTESWGARDILLLLLLLILLNLLVIRGLLRTLLFFCCIPLTTLVRLDFRITDLNHFAAFRSFWWISRLDFKSIKLMENIVGSADRIYVLFYGVTLLLVGHLERNIAIRVCLLLLLWFCHFNWHVTCWLGLSVVLTLFSILIIHRGGRSFTEYLLLMQDSVTKLLCK